MNRPLHRSVSPLSPVVIERAGGGLARIAEDPAPIRALRGLAREGAEILGSERTAIWRMGPAGMPIRCLTRFHRTSRTHEDDVGYPDELGRETWRLLERLSVLAMDDVKGGPAPTPVLRNYLQECGARALLAIPIRHRGLLAGFLAFEELDGPRRWTPRDREQASTLAFRLERHWARYGTSVTPSTSSPGIPRRAARRADVDEGVPDPTAPDPTAPHPTAVDETVMHEAAPKAPGDALSGLPAPGDNGAASAATAASEPSVATTHPEIGAVTHLETEAETETAPDPTVRSFGHRRELRARLQRLRTLERSGILGTRTAREVLHWMDLQQGTLELLGAELGARLGTDGTAAALLGDLRDTLKRARSELEQFLVWSRFGLQAPPPTELNALVGGLAIRLGKLTGDRVGLLYAPSSEPVRMTAQPDLLERALEALVRNARAASRPGDRVRVGVQRGEEPGGRRVARLVVEDQGSGIAPANLPWIFEPWFTTQGDGVDGLGLPLVQAVVEGHGGWVDVTSTEGKGSRFVLNFPLHDPALSPEGAAEADGTGTRAGATPSSAALVLLVEDEPLTARLLRRALEGAGFRVLSAEGGPDGIRLVREEALGAALLVAERVLVDGGEGVDLLREGRILQPYLGGILLDRHLRPGADDDVLARIRSGTRIPSDVALIPAPFHPGSLVAEARRLASVPRDKPESPAEADGDPHGPTGSTGSTGSTGGSTLH